MKLTLFIISVLVLISCKHQQRQKMIDFRSTVYLELSAESKRMVMDESWAGANKYRIRNAREDFHGLDSYYEKLDSLMQFYQDGIKKLNNTLLTSELKTKYLELRFNYKTPKDIFEYPIDEKNLATLNPDDSADFVNSVELFDFILNTDLPPILRSLYLTELTNQYFNYYPGQLPSEFNFFLIELIESAKQSIWKKGEKGYLFVGYYNVDARDHSKIKIGDQIFNERPVILKAPKEKGLHEIKGELYIKEAGVEVAKPFTYRIWVE